MKYVCSIHISEMPIQASDEGSAMKEASEKLAELDNVDVIRMISDIECQSPLPLGRGLLREE